MYTGPLDWAEAGCTTKAETIMNESRIDKVLRILELYPIADLELIPAVGMDLENILCRLL